MVTERSLYLTIAATLHHVVVRAGTLLHKYGKKSKASKAGFLIDIKGE
jgi:hypothetical protein